MEAGDFGGAACGVADPRRADSEASAVDNNRSGNGEVDPAKVTVIGGADCGVEALAEGGPGAAFQLDAGTVDPGGVLDGHGVGGG